MSSHVKERAGQKPVTTRSRRSRTAAHAKPARPGLIVASLAFTGLVAAFMLTLMTPLVPELPRLLGASRQGAQWTLTITLLCSAVATPISGRLGDLYGKRRVTLVILALVVVGSVIALFASSLLPLLVARALQGAGIGVIPLGLSILRDAVPQERLGSAVALVSATLGIGGAVGLPVAALISQYMDWHYLFVLATLLSLASLLMVWRLVPENAVRSEGSFDIVGAIGLGIGLVAVLLGVTEGREWGWGSASTLGLMIGGVVVLLLWGLFELRTRSPLIDLRVAGRRTVLFTNIASITVGFGYFGTVVMFPQLLEAPTGTGVGLGQSMLVASLCLAPSGVVMWGLSPVAARLSKARGARTSLLLGIAILAVANFLGLHFMTEVWHAILIATIVGFGVGFAYASMPTLIMGAVPASETAASNGLNSVMRSLGSTLASAVLGVVLSSRTVTVGRLTTPSVGGFHLAFVVTGVVAIIGVVCTFVVPRHHPAYRDASIPDADDLAAA